MLPSKTVPENMRRAQARKRKHSGKRAGPVGDDRQPSQATTPSVTPASSIIVDGSAQETKQVSWLIISISMTNIIYQRYQTQSIYFIRFSQVLCKASKQRTAISFTNPITVEGRFWGLQERWRIISMVWRILYDSSLHSTHTIWATIFQASSEILGHARPICSSSIVTSKIVSRRCHSHRRRRKSHRVRLGFHPQSLLSWWNAMMPINSRSRMPFYGNRRKLQYVGTFSGGYFLFIIIYRSPGIRKDSKSC